MRRGKEAFSPALCGCPLCCSLRDLDRCLEQNKTRSREVTLETSYSCWYLPPGACHCEKTWRLRGKDLANGRISLTRNHLNSHPPELELTNAREGEQSAGTGMRRSLPEAETHRSALSLNIPPVLRLFAGSERSYFNMKSNIKLLQTLNTAFYLKAGTTVVE